MSVHSIDTSIQTSSFTYLKNTDSKTLNITIIIIIDNMSKNHPLKVLSVFFVKSYTVTSFLDSVVKLEIVSIFIYIILYDIFIYKICVYYHIN